MKVTATQSTDAAAPASGGWQVEGANPEAFRAFLERAGIDVRAGETVKQVKGHHYIEVVDGAREGMYINTSGNVRHGRAFVVAHRDGREYHVYGSGKDRLVVGMHKRRPEAAGTPDTSEIQLRKGETLKPVDDRHYAEITSGPR